MEIIPIGKLSILMLSSFSRFVLFGGNVSGKYDEIIPNKKITQTWRLKQWPAGHYSNVVMELEQKVS